MDEIEKKLAILKAKADIATGRYMQDLFNTRKENAWKTAQRKLKQFMAQWNIK